MYMYAYHMYDIVWSNRCYTRNCLVQCCNEAHYSEGSQNMIVHYISVHITYMYCDILLSVHITCVVIFFSLFLKLRNFSLQLTLHWFKLSWSGECRQSWLCAHISQWDPSAFPTQNTEARCVLDKRQSPRQAWLLHSGNQRWHYESSCSMLQIYYW